MKTFFCLALFILSFNIRAQYRYGPVVQFGFSHVWSDFDDELLEHRRLFGAAYSLGFFGEKNISAKSSLGICLQLQHIGSHEETEGAYYTPRNASHSYQDVDTYRRSLGYLSIPIYYSYDYSSKIKLQVGWNTSFFLVHFQNYIWARHRDDKFVPTYLGQSKYLGFAGDDRYTFIDFGPQLGVLYSFKPHWQIQATYYHGLQQIVASRSDWQAYNRSFQLGLRYILKTVPQS
ncbi:outer membrane beta-barrel protein [Croceimicrobium sp.]|uniref:outer membrane beta-barrel protein n=1 Tax=Croceimicrobium sp. TaxID=2828340 RepID=UPI003BA8DF17